MVLLIALATFASTCLGGLLALQFRDKLHLVLGFSAGAVIGVAFFDLLPESIEIGKAYYSVSLVTSVIALGFLLYMILDRTIVIHLREEDEHCTHTGRGRLGAGSLAIHSFLDGFIIGVSFQVSTSLGLIVTVAVLVHDFSDGINTVGMILKGGGTRKEAFAWLLIDSIAPLLGIATAMFVRVPESMLGLVLSLFCGFFLYIGASDLLPESHHAHPTRWTSFMTVLGVIVLYLAVKLAGV
jgi:zinc transporter ZupT